MLERSSKNIYSSKNNSHNASRSRVKSTDPTKQSNIETKAEDKNSKSIEKKKVFDYKKFNKKFKEKLLSKKLSTVAKIDHSRSKSKKKHDFFNSDVSGKKSESSMISEISHNLASSKKRSYLSRNISNSSKPNHIRNKINTIMMRSLSKKYKREIKESLKNNIIDDEQLTKIIEDLKKENINLYKKNENLMKIFNKANRENLDLQERITNMQKTHLQTLKIEKQKVYNLLEEKEEMTSIIEELINEITILKDEVKLLTRAESLTQSSLNIERNTYEEKKFEFPDWSKTTFKTFEGDTNTIQRVSKEFDILPFLHSIKEEDQEAEDYNSDNNFQSSERKNSLRPKQKTEDENVLTENKNISNITQNCINVKSKEIEEKEKIQVFDEKKYKGIIEALEDKNKKLIKERKNLVTNLKLLKAKYMQSLMSLRLEKVQVKELKRQIQFSNTSGFMESVLENGKDLFVLENENDKVSENLNKKSENSSKIEGSVLHYDSEFDVGDGDSGITPIRDNPETNGRQNTQDETTDGFLNMLGSMGDPSPENMKLFIDAQNLNLKINEINSGRNGIKEKLQLGAGVEPVDTRIMSPVFTETPDRQMLNGNKSPLDFCATLQEKALIQNKENSEKSSKDVTLKQTKSSFVVNEKFTHTNDYTNQLLQRISSLEKCIQEKNSLLGIMKKEKLDNYKEIMFLKNQNQLVVSQSIHLEEGNNP